MYNYAEFEITATQWDLIKKHYSEFESCPDIDKKKDNSQNKLPCL